MSKAKETNMCSTGFCIRLYSMLAPHNIYRCIMYSNMKGVHIKAAANISQAHPHTVALTHSQ